MSETLKPLSSISAQDILASGIAPQALPTTPDEMAAWALADPAQQNNFWVDENGNFWQGTLGSLLTGGVDVAADIAAIFQGQPTIGQANAQNQQMWALMAAQQRQAQATKNRQTLLFAGIGLFVFVLLIFLIRRK